MSLSRLSPLNDTVRRSRGLRPLALRSRLTFSGMCVACVVRNVVSCLCHQLDLCVKYVDESNIGPLAKALQELFARGVGLPTKCGTAHMISSLTMVVRNENPILAVCGVACAANGVRVRVRFVVSARGEERGARAAQGAACCAQGQIAHRAVELRHRGRRSGPVDHPRLAQALRPTPQGTLPPPPPPLPRAAHWWWW